MSLSVSFCDFQAHYSWHQSGDELFGQFMVRIMILIRNPFCFSCNFCGSLHNLCLILLYSQFKSDLYMVFKYLCSFTTEGAIETSMALLKKTSFFLHININILDFFFSKLPNGEAILCIVFKWRIAFFFCSVVQKDRWASGWTKCFIHHTQSSWQMGEKINGSFRRSSVWFVWCCSIWYSLQVPCWYTGTNYHKSKIRAKNFLLSIRITQWFTIPMFSLDSPSKTW